MNENKINIQIKFCTKDIDLNNHNLIEKYYTRDKKNPNKIILVHEVNIAKCYHIWHNGLMYGYSKNDQELIKMCALLCTDNINEFANCLSQIDIDQETKKSMFETFIENQ